MKNLMHEIGRPRSQSSSAGGAAETDASEADVGRSGPAAIASSGDKSSAAVDPKSTTGAASLRTAAIPHPNVQFSPLGNIDSHQARQLTANSVFLVGGGGSFYVARSLLQPTPVACLYHITGDEISYTTDYYHFISLTLHLLLMWLEPSVSNLPVYSPVLAMLTGSK